VSATPESIRHWLAELGERGPVPDAGGQVDVLRAVRGYLAAAREHLAEVHRASRSGSRVNGLHSDLMDRLVRRLYRIAESEGFAQEGIVPSRAAILAVGGYARREMSIHSDVDLLLLHEGPVTPYVTRLSERIQLWLWDAGLTVGCATRTGEETLELARADNTVFTGILDTRFLAGDPVFYHEFTDAIRRELLADVEHFLLRQIDAAQQRHASYGESLYLLQPNLKEGAGGLRDYHAAIWAMRAVLPSARGLEDLLHYGLLTEPEMEDYRDALDFLWWVRNELHLLAARRQDQMSFETQEQIAAALGYPDGGPEAPLPVELFMGDYYRHARAIRSYSELAIEQCRARVRRAQAPQRVLEVEDGFRVVGDHLELPHAAHLRERPLRLLSAFAVAQENDVALSRTAERLVRENLHLVDDAFRRDPETTAAFLRILDSEKRVMRTLMTMNEIGLLARYLPEWEHIVCRWQHVIYHTYTVDVHSIFLVEELRRLWGGKYERALPDLTALMRDAEDRPVLFLGSLLHDIGKGFGGGDHSAKGTERARLCLARLALDPERVERIVFLVQHHLTMSHIGQRRDLADPKMIFEFAKLVGDRTNLRNLYLLTFADMRASSKAGWNEWRWALLRELFERAAEVLETGGPDEGVAIATIESRVATRQQGAREELRALGVAEAKIDGFFDEMPRRYFVSHGPRQIARHARALLAFTEARGVVTAVREMRGGFSEVIAVTRDVHGLYWRVAGTLTAKGINIYASNVYTTRSGLALEVYRVATPPGVTEDRERTWEGFEASLRKVLAGEVRVEDLVKRRRRPIGATATPSRTPPSVTIENDESDFYTIVDVSANDRLGLLYDLTRTLAEHDLEIYISKATTVLDQVADTFYVKDARDGGTQKLADPERIEALQRALLEAAQLDEAQRDEAERHP
jgi:[protein-PII] uridylyltransferase